MRISDWSSDVCSSDLAGKITVVWAAPTGTTSEIRRTVLQPGSTTWSPALRIGTVTNPRPKLTHVQNLTIVTAGQGRENGRASSRESECRYVSISVVAVSIKKKKKNNR